MKRTGSIAKSSKKTPDANKSAKKPAREIKKGNGAAWLAWSPDWRERYNDKTVKPSFYNARLAISALNIECSYDTFHNRMLVGYQGGKRHAVDDRILGDVSDNSLLALRQIISDRFSFDPTDRHVRDAVMSLALERCFDPIADMLIEAEKNWDGKKRLNRMAADYLNCEDTPLNAACIRKMMIAAVARVRDPGCKFDTIVVLESKEGYNKSTALRILAGDENFSDEPIIGRESREVQEQLANIWIHENADLAGMKKADVDQVKTFASRQVDRARPAYGHFQKEQPRHSIEVGTTNSSEYLQSQTGNRRFAPMIVLEIIDIEKLKRDRLQLWGEAAHYWSKGESLMLDETLWPVAAIEQEKRRVKDGLEDALADIDPMYTQTKDNLERISSVDLMTEVLKVPTAQQTTSFTMRLANTMKRLGWQRPSNGNVVIDGQQVKGYFRDAKKPQKGKDD